MGDEEGEMEEIGLEDVVTDMVPVVERVGVCGTVR